MKSISITFTEETWNQIINKLLTSESSYLQLLGKMLIEQMAIQKNLQVLKEKANI